MFSRLLLLPVAGLLSVAAPFASAQNERHGRKYKAPPETSHLEVLVVKDTNGKILENAAVIFHPTKDGDDEGNLEVKSGTDGKAFIDVIPTGSDVDIQIISSGYATYAGKIKLTGPSHSIVARMKRPQGQVSTYQESGMTESRRVGVQEPAHRTLDAAAPKPLSASEPVLKLPSLPAKAANANGDSTIPKDHNVPAPPGPPAKQPSNSSAPLGPTVDGTAAGSPSNP